MTGIQQTRLGRPEREETFLAEDRVGGIYGAIQRAYPPTTPENRFTHIQQWTWRVDDCILTLWFHAPKADQWQVLGDLYRHKDAAF